jgi:hypothetical protein
MLKPVLAAIAFAVLAVTAAPTAQADYLDRHQLWALSRLAAPICENLNREPNPFTMARWVQSIIGFTMPDGHYFFDDEADDIVFAAINSECPQHKGLFFQYGFVYGIR